MYSEESSEVESYGEERLEVTTHPAKQATDDRRRPGRNEYPSPALISLLRHPTIVIDTEADDNGLSPSRGIALGVLLSIPLWAIIITGVLWTIW
jgi:hypothetical protein